ncbi:hypothetical protein E2C01_047969 [Portunus trituberculatus]|uniref:Uncharacterized protein n=1 Tax=Portunus trituberculatus TaxID=210409 RepID=A0A5B7G516_PORTR|nr:hypothetical protein [Portunus trituberculatus]
MDIEIQRFVSKACHLPHDTPVFLHMVVVVEGSLEIPLIVARVPHMRGDLMECLTHSLESSVSEVAGTTVDCQQ